jgi:cytochrome c-type biogenesis protein
MVKKVPLLLLLGLLSAIAAIGLSRLTQAGVTRPLDLWVTELGMQYRQWFQLQKGSSFPVWLGLSFSGGLVASISPCILSLLPINLSYIGTRDIQSRWDALTKASAFVLGVVTTLSLFGIFSAFAGFVLIKFTGYFHLIIGLLIITMGLVLSNTITLPPILQRLRKGAVPSTNDRPSSKLHQWGQNILTGSYGVGLTFALVSSPCSSPILFAVLSVAATTESQLQSGLLMVSYSLGYTAIIFFASLFTGFVKQTRGLLGYADRITQLASLALLVTGGFYVINGGQWIISHLNR